MLPLPLDLWFEDPAPVWLSSHAPRYSTAWWRHASAEILRRRAR